MSLHESKIRKFIRLVMLGIITISVWLSFFVLLGLDRSGGGMDYASAIGKAYVYFYCLVISGSAAGMQFIYALWIRPWRMRIERWVFLLNLLITFCTAAMLAAPFF